MRPGISIRHNLEAVAKDLDELGRKQLPFALATALTWTAQEVRDDARARLPDHFTVRSTWVEKSLQIDKANKKDPDPTAYVGSLYDPMGLHGEGGVKRGRGGRSVGVPVGIAQGSTIAIWMQREDAAAQAALAALEGGDGIREDLFVDGRFGEDLLTATLDALLDKYSYAIVSAAYGTLDAKSRVGAVVAIGLSTSFLGTFDPAFYSSVYGTVTGSTPYGLSGDFTIQDIVITFIGANLTPRFQVTASSFSFTVMDLQRLALLG